MVRVGIVGGTGYTGVELLRILVLHPEVEVAVVTSRSDSGQRVDALYPSLRGLCDDVAPGSDLLRPVGRVRVDPGCGEAITSVFYSIGCEGGRWSTWLVIWWV